MASHTKSASISTPTLYDSTVSPPTSPSKPFTRPTHKARRPSISNTMSKLKDSFNHSHIIDGLQHKRAHSHSRTHEGPYKGLQISEPKLTGSLDQLAAPRLGPLGSGATVVRTPQEALSLAANKSTSSNTAASSSSGASVPYHRVQASASAPSRIHVYQPETVREEDSEIPPSPKSPPLPPLPSSPLSQNAPVRLSHTRRSAGSNSHASSSRIFPPAPPPPSGQLPLTPDVSPQLQQRASLKSEGQMGSRSSSRSKSAAMSSRSRSSWSPLQLTPDLLEAAPQAPFAPVLMSNLPANMQKIDPSRVLVILETSTSTTKTTLKTLSSRSSYLATYLVELVGSTCSSTRTTTDQDRVDPIAEGDGESVYSQRSEFHDSDVDEEDGFNSIFQNHLAATGIIKPQRPKRRADASSTIHVFLDRPSSPYSHILSYLRASLQTLPYAVRLFASTRGSFSPSRLETLLELRDEAAYLGLVDLQKLCDEEMAVAFTAASTAVSEVEEGEQARSSVHSTHTLIDPSTDTAEKLLKENAHSSPKNHNLAMNVQTVDVPVMLPRERSPMKIQYTNTSSTYSNGSDTARRPRQAFPSDVLPSRDEVTNSLHIRATSPTRREFDRVKPLGNYF